VQRSLGRTYHDPLHGAISLSWADPTEALLIRLIDTPAFQRLRRIRQLGPASLTFHGAEASRFTHSLGVMAIARRAFDQLLSQCPELQPHRATVLCAALLHDIGHGPFSHTCEELFGSQHEHWTERILRESAPVRDLLDAYDPTLLQQIEQVYRKQHPFACVWQLVTSQLDCDRLDYLMRDSYFTGASYGKLDLDRIMLAMRYDPEGKQLVIAQKGVSAIEHYLIVRYLMYAQIYNHPKNIAATWVLEQAFRRARILLAEGSLPVDETVEAWLQHESNHLTLDQYLAADDGVFLYHLQRWQRHPDPVLADLSRRFIDRDLFKTWDITTLSSEQQQDLLHRIQNWLQQAGFIAPYYTGIRTVFSRGYTLYHQGIKVQTLSGVQEISELSPLVQTLTSSRHRSWLIYPREAEEWLLALSLGASG